MTATALFDQLDLDGDGLLSRAELSAAARRLGWHWHEAPYFAVLDYLTIRSPLARRGFDESLERMLRDPNGPYGEILTVAAHFAELNTPLSVFTAGPRAVAPPAECDRLARYLAESAGAEAATDYETLLNLTAAPWSVARDAAALLVIDPQVSFTRGAWMQSLGARGFVEIEPLRIAFQNCAALLGALPRPLEVMFSRCPFPPASYGWDRELERLLPAAQPYFVKPGNSVLWPPTNGVREWVAGLLDRGSKTLAVAGCTLNSCVRVSAVALQREFGGQGLSVVVDLSLCGARRGNYLRSAEFAGLSSVATAVNEMTAAGVTVIAGDPV